MFSKGKLSCPPILIWKKEDFDKYHSKKGRETVDVNLDTMSLIVGAVGDWELRPLKLCSYDVREWLDSVVKEGLTLRTLLNLEDLVPDLDKVLKEAADILPRWLPEDEIKARQLAKNRSNDICQAAMEGWYNSIRSRLPSPPKFPVPVPESREAVQFIYDEARQIMANKAFVDLYPNRSIIPILLYPFFEVY